ncbi:MAG: hypothetical protein J6Y91_00425 [Alphaproteobacteria bacterium]|nr:hypothetical protein [Alphaproteobacteria bacterium]
MNKHFIGYSYVEYKGSVHRATFECDEDGRVFYSICFIGKMKDIRGPLKQENVIIADKAEQIRLISDAPVMLVSGKQQRIPRAVAVEMMNGYLIRKSDMRAEVPTTRRNKFTAIMANSGFVRKELQRL